MSSTKFIIYYDASCPLCLAEMTALKAEDHRSILELRDCSPVQFIDRDAEQAAITRQQMMQALYVRNWQGQWFIGVDAFIQIYRAMGIETMARLWEHRWLKPLWQRAYPWIARHRIGLSKLGLQHLFEWIVRRAAVRAARRRCDNGACDIAK